MAVSVPTQKLSTSPLDVLVIGAGLAGLVAGWHASRLGQKTRVIAKGWGATHWGSGCIDVLGYLPADYAHPVASPLVSLAELITTHPEHPYALVGLDRIEQALAEFQTLFEELGYPLQGTLQRNWLLPTALGAIRPTCLVPLTMLAGDLNSRDPMLIVGFNQYLDFYPRLVADNLEAQNYIARELSLDLPELKDSHIVSTLTLAHLFDSPEFRRSVAQAILPRLGSAQRVGFPAVLGIQQPLEVLRDLEQQLGLPVFEFPGLPPSIPGIRLHNMLIKAIQTSGGQVFSGMQVTSAKVVVDRITFVASEAAARTKSHHARHYILATGGLLGGGLIAHQPGYAQETIFNLPVSAPTTRANWFIPEYFSPQGQPIFKTGIAVNSQLAPVDPNGQVLITNLSIAGAALGGIDPLRERSLEGISVATGYWAANHIGEVVHE